MGETIHGLERRREQIVQQIAGLGDLRPGCVTAIRKKCGKSNCCCVEADHPGHGPHWRLTYKNEGRTQTESLTGDAIKKAEGEIAEFRRYQEFSREFVEVNTRLCRLRTVEGAGQQEKKLQNRSKRK